MDDGYNYNLDLLHTNYVILMQACHLKPFLLTRFRNEGKDGPFNDVIANFSLDTKSLAAKYEDVQLQLTFLNTEVKDQFNSIKFILLSCFL